MSRPTQFVNLAKYILAHVKILVPFRLRLKAVAMAHVNTLVPSGPGLGAVALAHVKILAPSRLGLGAVALFCVCFVGGRRWPNKQTRVIVKEKNNIAR